MRFFVFIFSSFFALNVQSAFAQNNQENMMNHAAHTAMKIQTSPTLPGQDAFGAIQEIVTLLEADPTTDWSTVNISGLRQHLVDMNLMVLKTTVRRTQKSDGLSLNITGQGRTLQAIHAMIPAHVPMIQGLNGWTVKAELTADGAVLAVTSTNPKEVAHIQGLGFYGLMVSGSHHQAHHFGLARGQNVHGH